MGHLTLSELTRVIKSALDNQLEPSYWLVAEISEIRITQKGHCYLELVEKMDDQIIAKLRANIWSYTYRNLSTWFETMTGQGLNKGMKILANAVVQYHEVFGLSLVVRDIDPNFTLGEREQRRREIIDQLIKEGVYDMNRELTLPTVPQHIAVISSPTAAGLEDFMNQLRQNSQGYHFNIRLYQAIMQGTEAEESIIQSLHRIFDRFQQFDVVVLIRGGGSQVDLDCFNSYTLASHIAQFPIPVITGIGHERDETIVDLVAHTKMKTPTAVSEFLIQGFREYEGQLDLTVQRLSNQVRGRIALEKQQLESSLQRLILLAQGQVRSGNQGLRHQVVRIATATSNRILQNNARLDALVEKLNTATRRTISSQHKHLDHLEHSLSLMDPGKILQKGYSITLVNKKPINKVETIGEQDLMLTKTSDWEVESKVQSATRIVNG